MHVLTAGVMELLGDRIQAARNETNPTKIMLTDALSTLPRRERYLAYEQRNTRYDVGVKYGLLNAQLALALDGVDRERVLSLILELLVQRERSGRDEGDA